ncbi:MAG TPA: rhodanese-like domain-containing protein [Bacteroidales bacterium]|nr:rhodanese-like domain-containing protein [Bacteroidales bacterium]
MKEISGNLLLKLIGRPDTHIIDVRPVDAYNGWQLRGERRGGHIRGARSLPAKWADYIDWIEVVRHKGILPGNQIVIYGYDDAEIEKTGKRFVKAGYGEVSVYRHFKEEWADDDGYPMDSLPRYRNLVYPEWINMLINKRRPPFYNNNNYVIVHAHYRYRQAYLGGHIPGAIDMDTLALEEPSTWNRRNPSELNEALLSHGITSDTTVILYGKFMFPDNNDPFPGSAAGDIGAMRCAFIMMYAGVRDVRILNGGFRSWEDAGLPVSYTDEPKNRANDFGVQIPANPSIAVDTPEAKVMLASDGSELVCVRSYSEYIGEVSGYNYIEKKGRIPGALFADCGSDAYHMENYRNVDNSTREYNEIDSIWQRNGITPDKHLAFYCGTGWRGSEAFINAWLMGYPRISVYDGGWFEWSSDPSNPVETGVPIPGEVHNIYSY